MMGNCAGEPRPEIFMTDSNPWHNPSEDYPPSRPGKMMFLGAAVVCALGAVVASRYFPIQNCPKITPSSSSVSARPTMSPMASIAARNSSATNSGDNA